MLWLAQPQERNRRRLVTLIASDIVIFMGNGTSSSEPEPEAEANAIAERMCPDQHGSEEIRAPVSVARVESSNPGSRATIGGCAPTISITGGTAAVDRTGSSSTLKLDLHLRAIGDNTQRIDVSDRESSKKASKLALFSEERNQDVGVLNIILKLTSYLCR